MRDEAIITRFQESGALLKGHFVLSSGLHSPVYLQCAIALQSPVIPADFGAAIAERFQHNQIETVASPVPAVLIIRSALATHPRAAFVWTKPRNGHMRVPCC